eukprot:scaffold347_cov57-Phaeocystis_antarctica.AAC.1
MSLPSRRWPDRSDPRHFATPSRCGPSSPPQAAASQGGGASPAGLFRSGCGPEVHGLPIGSRAEPSPTRVRDGSLCAQEIWPATLSQPGCETAEAAGGRVGRGPGAGHAGSLSGAGCEAWPYAVGAGRPRGSTPRAASAARTARFESPAVGVPPTPFESLGLPAHLLHNEQFAQLSAEATRIAAAEAEARGELASYKESAAEITGARVAAEAKARSLMAHNNLLERRQARQGTERQGNGTLSGGDGGGGGGGDGWGEGAEAYYDASCLYSAAAAGAAAAGRGLVLGGGHSVLGGGHQMPGGPYVLGGQGAGTYSYNYGDGDDDDDDEAAAWADAAAADAACHYSQVEREYEAANYAAAGAEAAARGAAARAAAARAEEAWAEEARAMRAGAGARSGGAAREYRHGHGGGGAGGLPLSPRGQGVSHAMAMQELDALHG